MNFYFVTHVNTGKTATVMCKDKLEIGANYNLFLNDIKKSGKYKINNKLDEPDNSTYYVHSYSKDTKVLVDDGIKNIVFNEKKRTTTIIWKDGIVTTVRASENDIYSKEAGIALCFMKRVYLNEGRYNDIFRKWIKE